MARSLKTVILSQKETAERLGVTPRAVRNYVLEGMPKVGHGNSAGHPWPESREWYNDWLAKQERKKAPEDDLKEVRKRKLIAEMRQQELEVAREEGSVVPLADHEEWVEQLTRRMNQKIDSLAARITTDIQLCRGDLVSAQALAEKIADDFRSSFHEIADEIEPDDQLRLRIEGEGAA